MQHCVTVFDRIWMSCVRRSISCASSLCARYTDTNTSFAVWEANTIDRKDIYLFERPVPMNALRKRFPVHFISYVPNYSSRCAKAKPAATSTGTGANSSWSSTTRCATRCFRMSCSLASHLHAECESCLNHNMFRLHHNMFCF